jgi:hypothetical protein
MESSDADKPTKSAQVDEVKVFGFFGGDLPVRLHTESWKAKRHG